MSRSRIAIICVVLAFAAGVAALAFGRKGGDEGDQEASPTAAVTTAVIQSQPLKDTVSAYGVVQADPTGSETLAAPRAVIVLRMLARSGQSVAAGQPLAEIANAPASDLAYRQAVDASAAARTDLARVQRLFDDHLAASDQLGAAKKALADAQAALAAQQAQGGGKARQVLTAPYAAVVTGAPAAAGDHMAQDAPLLVLARRGALSVKLGLEPGARVSVGDTVTIRPVGGGPSIDSRVTFVSAAADPAAKTFDAVAPLAGATLPIGAAVQGDIAVSAYQGLLVPRGAVVFDETGTHVFVVDGGKARRVFITAGRDFDNQVEINGPVAAGQRVAVQGAYELQDGMAVKVAGK